MQDLVERSTEQRRFAMWMLTVFSWPLCCSREWESTGRCRRRVAQRAPEIGLRMALGATPGATVRLVLRQGLTLALIGIVLGAFSAAGLTRLMGKMLFDVRPLDPPAFAAATVVLGTFAWLACYLPVRRATRVDPLETLRRGT